MITRRMFLASGVAAAALGTTGWPARADDAPGITDTQIKIGQTMPYSGPASAYGVLGRTDAAYFRMINETGGINCRKINLISVDDGYSPPRTVEQVRRLVEEEQVAFMFHSLGTPNNTAVRQYLNAATVHRYWRQHILRSRAFSLDDGIQPELPDRGAQLRLGISC
jgi:ABC-type branched-subunit amino acid transport system substrate-binding protein